MTTATKCCYLQYLLNMLLSKLVDLLFPSDIKLIETRHNPKQCSLVLLIHLEVLMQLLEKELQLSLLGIHGQLSAEADLLLNVNVPVSMPTVLPLQAA